MKFLLFLLIVTFKTQAACLPEFTADLNLPLENSFYSIVEKQAMSFASRAKKTIAKDWDVIVRLDALNPRVNAQINKMDNVAVIEVWGGMLHQKRMDESVLTLLLCHELGHLLGGPPLKSRNGWSSTEGQADYYSTANCARIMGINEETFFTSAEKLTQIYAEVTGEIYPEIRICEQRVVERTNFGYPSAQCRLDTLLAGWENRARPVCWFRD